MSRIFLFGPPCRCRSKKKRRRWCNNLEKSGSDTSGSKEAEGGRSSDLSTPGAAGAGASIGRLSGLVSLATKSAAEGRASEAGGEGGLANGGGEGSGVLGDGGEQIGGEGGLGNRGSTGNIRDAQNGSGASGSSLDAIRGQGRSPSLGRDGGGSGIITGLGGSGALRALGGGGGGISRGSRDIRDSRGDGGRGIDRAAIGDAVILDNLGNGRVTASLVGAVVDAPAEVGGSAEARSITGSAVGELATSLALHVADTGFLYMVVSGVTTSSAGTKNTYTAFGEALGPLVLGHNGGSAESKDESSDGLHFGNVGGDVILGILQTKKSQVRIGIPSEGERRGVRY